MKHQYSNDERKAFQDLYKHTVSECGKCPNAYSCCDEEYCRMAARTLMSAGLDPADFQVPNGELPFLEANGCTVPPEYRPLCTAHVCSINSYGFKPDDPKWTEDYFKLRDQVNDILMKEEFGDEG